MIFIDTGAFLARHVARDQHHEAALAEWARLGRRPGRLCTSNLVLAETVTLLARRAGAAFAASRARAMLASGRLAMLRPDLDDEARAVDLLERYADQPLSFTDCVSFALMRRRGVGTAFTFDRHFALAGFKTLP